jgi:hypothetical protein
MSAPTEPTQVKSGIPFAVVSTVLFLIGIGAFGTASSGDVTMFGVTMEAKYACAIFFVFGAVFCWAALEAKRRGVRVL